MRLLFIFHDRPSYSGGPIVIARRLLPELVLRGHEVHCLVFFSGHDAPNVPYLESNGVHCYQRPRFDNTDRLALWILKCVSRIRPDVFIPNLSVPGWFAARWVRESGVPTVAVMHSPDEYHIGMIEQFVTGPKEWAVSGLVCVSEALSEIALQRSCDRTKVCVIPSGCAMPGPCSNQQGALRLVYAGRLVQEAKRVLEVVDAFALALNSGVAVEATLIGDGDQRFAVEKRIRLHGLEGRIRLTGLLAETELQAELAEHDVLVLLSDYEGTPGAIIDGMSAGLIPICLDIPGGVRSLVIHEQTGLLVQDRGGGFVSAVSRLAVDDKLRQKLAHNARAHVSKNFSLSATVGKWERFLAGLCNGRTPSSLPLRLPHVLTLPPVQPKLLRQDMRHVSRVQRFQRVLVRLGKRGLVFVRLLMR